MKYVAAVLLGLGVNLALLSTAAAQDALASIKAQGVIRVGTKVDFAPFGFKDASGAIVGFEPDLARDVADRLGVKLELVPVVSANRMEFLRQGKIDLMIATMSFRPERAEVVNIPQPFYYAGSQTGLALKSAGLKAWTDLKDKPVCGVQGAYYNVTIQKEGGRTVPFKDTEEAMAALKDGKCIAFVFDTTYFPAKLSSPDWTDYEMALPQINPEPWGLAVKKEDAKFGQFMADVVGEWHKNGKLIDLEKKWGIPASTFLQEMHEKYKS